MSDYIDAAEVIRQAIAHVTEYPDVLTEAYCVEGSPPRYCTVGHVLAVPAWSEVRHKAFRAIEAALPPHTPKLGEPVSNIAAWNDAVGPDGAQKRELFERALALLETSE